MADTRILILGVTASGKGGLAFEWARHSNGEIISIDSMKVYRRMDIGTAKPAPDRRRIVPYHMIDVVEPSQSYSAGLFVEEARSTMAQIEQRGRQVVAVGGTALYIKALLFGLFEGPPADPRTRQEFLTRAQAEGLGALHRELTRVDPAAADRISPQDAKRIIRALEVHRLTGRPISQLQSQFGTEKRAQGWTIIGLRRERPEEGKRINLRVKRMVEAGLVEEVRRLMAEDPPLSPQAGSAIGYAEVIAHLRGRTTLDEAIEMIKRNTRRLAKGQRTWFKTFRGVHWLDISPEESTDQVLRRAMAIGR